MNEEQKAAYIFSQGVCALIELESMKQANKEREWKGQMIAYGEEAFMELQEKYCIGHNAVIGFFRD